MEGTFWALVPTLVAVIVALVTKEVLLSLFAGVFVGSMFISGGDPIRAFVEMFGIMWTKTGADYMIGGGGATLSGLGNAGIIIFIVELGMLVVLMDRSGGTAAFGKKVASCIKSQKSALWATAGMGCLIFADDYFNRLAVGTVMRSAADRYGIPREKLAYIIGSVSVSICILIPISSWAGAITGNIAEGGAEDAFGIYLCTIACNFYPILTLLLLFLSPVINADLFDVRKCNKSVNTNSEPYNPKGSPMYLILPVFTLIVLSTLMMTLTTQGSEMTLVISGAVSVAVCLILCIIGRAIKPREIGRLLVEGLKSVGDVIMILVFAWTLTGVCDRLGVGKFIGGLTNGMGELRNLLPAIMFVLAMATSFATGTAWGTFGMLVPLTVPMFPSGTLQILTIAAVLSGSVFGNQVSPISDSTMLASKVCECDHALYIKTQIRAALPIAVCAFFGFLASGLSSHIYLGWLVSGTMFVAVLTISFLIKKQRSRAVKDAAKAHNL